VVTADDLEFSANGRVVIRSECAIDMARRILETLESARVIDPHGGPLVDGDEARERIVFDPDVDLSPRNDSA
jgi:hypothetical protein